MIFDVWVQKHVESSHCFCQNEAKFQTHPSSHVKMPNLQKTNVYNFAYKISVGILMKFYTSA